MPYGREVASKDGHAHFVRNPDVEAFLSECEYLRAPSQAEAEEMARSFSRAPSAGNDRLPRFVVAADASKSDTPISDQLPSTQIGFIKLSQVLIRMDQYAELVNPESRFVDPFKAAEIHRNASAITFTLPGSNVRFRGAKSVRDGFRRAVFEHLNRDLGQGANPMILSDTLLDLSDNRISVDRCPSCGSRATFSFTPATRQQPCPDCHEQVYVTDWLRLHEDVSDFGNNTSAMTRMMSVVEHLVLAALILQVFRSAPRSLANMAFVMDGPLAVFGQPAKLHARLMVLFHRVNTRLAELGLNPLLVIGLQKTGEVMDHANLLCRFLPDNVIRLIDDDYRNRYIKGSESPAENFGNETYYGQDFLFKTQSGRVFVFAVPYPFADKADGKRAFSRKKADPAAYAPVLGRACDLIRHFEFDLYRNAIVPVALAHRHASISIEPGGRVLDIITRSGMARTAGQ